MNYADKRQLILNGSMPRVIMLLAGPIMLNNLIQTLYNLADTFWVGRLGTNELAAMGLVFPFIFLIISLGMGMNVAGTAMISQYTGNDDAESARLVAGQIFTFALIISVVLGILGFFAAPLMVGFIKADAVVLELSAQYLSIMFLDMPVVFLFFVYNAIKQGQGDTFTPMVLNVCGVVLNIILDPIFIFNFGLGIRGAAIATIISRAIFAFYAIYTLFAHRRGVYLTKKNLKLKKRPTPKNYQNWSARHHWSIGFSHGLYCLKRLCYFLWQCHPGRLYRGKSNQFTGADARHGHRQCHGHDCGSEFRG